MKHVSAEGFCLGSQQCFLEDVSDDCGNVDTQKCCRDVRAIPPCIGQLCSVALQLCLMMVAMSTGKTLQGCEGFTAWHWAALQCSFAVVSDDGDKENSAGVSGLYSLALGSPAV